MVAHNHNVKSTMKGVSLKCSQSPYECNLRKKMPILFKSCRKHMSFNEMKNGDFTVRVNDSARQHHFLERWGSNVMSKLPHL